MTINTTKIIAAISSANHTFTEQVTLHYLTKSSCTACTYDPIDNESTNINCQVCNGAGFIYADSPIIIPCSLEQIKPYEQELLPTGMYDNTQVSITIDQLELLKYNIDVEDVSHFSWNGDNYRMISSKPGVLSGIVYEIDVLLEIIASGQEAIMGQESQDDDRDQSEESDLLQ
jgi:hypothetical protein